MTSDLIYGGRVIHHLDNIPDIGSTVIVIRHSERPSFGKMPVEQWDHVTITERGRTAARSFGKAISDRRRNHKLRVHSWGLKRCVDTAECIADGAKEAGYHSPGVTPLHIKPPVADNEAYNNLMRKGVWTEMLLGWLGEGTYESLVPMHEYATEVLTQLLDEDFSARGETTIIATHDLNIFPLVSYLQRKPVTKVDFLDGMVLKSDGKDVHVGFDASSRLIAHAEVFQRTG